MARALLSLNVSLARPMSMGGREVMTGIAKRPVEGPVAVGPLGLAGDEQADLSVHGGPGKAIYAYPSEHYPFWQTVRAQARAAEWGAELPPGLIGENLTLAGLLEDEVCIGDVLRFADCELAVSEPRFPCFKFNAAMGFKQASKLMVANGWCGFYLAVRQEGSLCAGEAFELIPGPREWASRSSFAPVSDTAHAEPAFRALASGAFRRHAPTAPTTKETVMSLISFIKEAGEKLFGRKEAAATAPVDVDAANKTAADAITAYINTQNLKVDNLDVAFDGATGTVSVAGEAADQATKEKVILCCGNVHGVTQVDDSMTVAEPAEESRWYTVVRGDTLSAIAKTQYGNANEYPKIFEANKPMLTHPDKIYPGQVLRIPA